MLVLKVWAYFDCNSTLERSMLKIVNQIILEEKVVIRDGQDHKDVLPLLSKIQELKDEGRWCLLYDNMHGVIDALHDNSHAVDY